MSAVAKVLPVVAGVALIATGVGAPAGAGLLATVGAGAEIAGGALMLLGAATGNKNLEKTGGLIGLGGVALGAFAPAGAAAADTGGMQVATEMGTAPAEGAASAAPSAAPAAAADTGGMQVATTMGAGTAPAGVEAASVNNAILAGQQQMLKYSLISGALSGGAQAYGARQAADIQAQTAANQLQLQKEAAARANTAGVGVGTALAAASQPAQAAQPGLLASGIMPPISAPNVIQQPPLGIQPPAIVAPQPLKLA